MKNRAKKPVAALFLAVIILIMGGCGIMHDFQHKIEQGIMDKKDIYLAHMEEKYDIRFLPISYSPAGVVTNEEFRCYAEGTNPEKDRVTVFTIQQDNGEEVIVDDYFGVMIRDEYQRRVDAICDDVIGASKAYVHGYSVSFFDNSLAVGSTIDDAIAMGERINAGKYIYFEVMSGDEEIFEEQCERIAEKLKEARLPGITQFFGLAEGELENITEDNFLDYLPSIVSPDGTICLMMAEHLVSLY